MVDGSATVLGQLLLRPLVQRELDGHVAHAYQARQQPAAWARGRNRHTVSDLVP